MPTIIKVCAMGTREREEYNPDTVSQGLKITANPVFSQVHPHALKRGVIFF